MGRQILSTRHFLQELKRQRGIRSDYELARILGVSRAGVSKWQNRKSQMDDYRAVLVAQLLGRDPLEVLAWVNCERAKRPAEREFWRSLAVSRSSGN